MKLIGMLDSPYVRRVAISLQLLKLPFEHEPLSVFRTLPQFKKINPVVKAPTFVCDDGEVLMDSTLILQYAERLAQPRTLTPSNIKELQYDLRITGLALAACEKSVQIFYEKTLRSPEKLDPKWLGRIADQVRAAYDEIEREIARRPLAAGSDVRHAGVCVAVAWNFTQQLVATYAPADQYPTIAAFSSEAESLPAFRAAPHGDGVVGSTHG